MRVMFFEAADDIGDIDRFETCCECGEVVYAGMMPRHFAKDHARFDDEEYARLDLAEGCPYEAPPVSAFVLESRTRPFIPSLVGVHAWAAKMLQEAY